MASEFLKRKAQAYAAIGEENNAGRETIRLEIDPTNWGKFYELLLLIDGLNVYIKNKIQSSLQLIQIKTEQLERDLRLNNTVTRKWSGFNDKTPVFDFNKNENIVTWLDQINTIIELRMQKRNRRRGGGV